MRISAHAASLGILLAGASPGLAQVASLISRNSGQEPADSHSYFPSLSSDGRYVAFDSWAGNLAPLVDVSNAGVFVRDVVGGSTALASGAGGIPPNGKSYMSAISGDGGSVAFWSQASNLVAGDTNGEEDLFVYDRVAATLTRVNVSNAGAEAAPGDNNFHIIGERPALSADGRFVAFDSKAPNLVADDTNSVSDVFVRDRLTGTTERISLNSDGSQATSVSKAPAISADGRYVAFWSQDALTPDDVNGNFDVYVFDRQGPALERIGATFGGPPSISADGRFVAFESNATDLVPGDTNGKRDVFVYDRTLTQMTRVSIATGGTQGNDDSSEAAISGDGRYVAFRSGATNLVAGDLNGDDDIFLHDRDLGITTRISMTAAGFEADGFSRRPSISGDGFFVAFESAATNFGFDDSFGAVDLFLAVREDACPADPAKLFAGVCGCGTPDGDPDGDGTPDCNDGCPSDPGKVSPGLCGCGVGDADTDADGTPDCHDPATTQAVKLLVQQAIGVVKKLTPRARDRGLLVGQLPAMSAALLAAQNNVAFSPKQQSLLGAAAQALSELATAEGKAAARARRKATRALRKLLKAVAR